MSRLFHLAATAALVAAVLCACGSPHGQPSVSSEVIAPDQIADFNTLYSENCSACHGAEGKGGAAIALADPVYLAIADDAAMRKVIANGTRGTAMPAFAQSAGGMLTTKQVDILASGIRSRWSRPGILDSATAPSYVRDSAGNATQGALAFNTFCATCHGSDGRGTPKGSAITDPTFLSLVSDQTLRTLVIVGRPELGAPDWRSNVPGKPMTEQDVTDVVAWLTSQRPQISAAPTSVANSALPPLQKPQQRQEPPHAR